MEGNEYGLMSILGSFHSRRYLRRMGQDPTGKINTAAVRDEKRRSRRNEARRKKAIKKARRKK